MQPRPRLVVSRCLELEACRYNAVSIRAPWVRRLEPFVDLAPVCPEVEIGLGVPRDPVRLVTLGGATRMVQPSTGRDLTEAMSAFADRFLDGAEPIDGFLLKSRSPSCGIKDTKIYSGSEQPMPSAKGPGLFAAAVLGRFADRAVEDEGRLTNFRLRHHFLVKLFLLARLRELEASGRFGDLVAFHARHKLLLMAYREAALRRLGRLVADGAARPLAELVAAYRALLAQALAQPARASAHVNVLMHAMGYFKRGLSPREKSHFLAVLEEYRAGRLPLLAPLTTLRSWIERFDEGYLAAQAYFEPYPPALLDLADSGDGGF